MAKSQPAYVNELSNYLHNDHTGTFQTAVITLIIWVETKFMIISTFDSTRGNQMAVHKL